MPVQVNLSTHDEKVHIAVHDCDSGRHAEHLARIGVRNRPFAERGKRSGQESGRGNPWLRTSGLGGMFYFACWPDGIPNLRSQRLGFVESK